MSNKEYRITKFWKSEVSSFIIRNSLFDIRYSQLSLFLFDETNFGKTVRLFSLSPPLRAVAKARP
jgi:hypothetical protein